MKGYKCLTNDLESPNNNKFSYATWENETFKTEGDLKPCNNGLHLYRGLDNLSIGAFGERVFEAEIIGEYIDCEDGKFCCREIKLVRELTKEELRNITDSRWAFAYCYFIENDKAIANNITESEWAYYYCRDVENDKDIANKITECGWAFEYCKYVEYDEEMYRRIKK